MKMISNALIDGSYINRSYTLRMVVGHASLNNKSVKNSWGSD